MCDNIKELAGTDGDIDMGDDAVYPTPNNPITQRQQQGRQKGACWYIDMEDDVVDTAPDPCCVPFDRTPWSHQLGHAVDSCKPCLFECFSSLPDCFYLAVWCACLAAQLACFGKRVAATVADFVIILQLYLVKTHPRPTPLRSSRAIKLPSCHIAGL